MTDRIEDLAKALEGGTLFLGTDEHGWQQYDTGVTKKAAQALREMRATIERLEGERQEQIDVLFSVGLITCRNGEQHEHLDGCIYCALDALKRERDEARLAMNHDDVAQLRAYNEQLQARCDEQEKLITWFTEIFR